MLSLTRIHLAIALAMTLIVPTCLFGQSTKPDSQSATIIGTVIDVNGDPVPNAKVELKSVGGSDPRIVTTSERGAFEFDKVPSGISYEITITAQDFGDWKSSSITLEPGQFKIVTGVQLQIRPEVTEVQVRDPLEVAREQLKAEEHQRVLGFVPNFYVTYEKDPAPLTTRMKFQLALKTSTDPITAAGVLGYAGIRQAANSPKFGQGWGAFGERFGATAADAFSDIMIGGAILPSLLHQDPRYFYQGTGTTGSRIRHAIFSPFVARGDNGSWQPNYSSIGGDLASSALSNLYFPQANRGVGLVFGNFAIGTAERIGASLAQEFIIGKFTKRRGHME
ncbi:MAG TPA: carboxypeptidase-like regulatory domain-containing protein [Terriglobales bacterium]|nr:carboxypeptidase-like regulatory domain-containing protein [Terriglobales bacterium]